MKFSVTTWINGLALAFIGLTLSQNLNAQTDFTSPYSIFGPGRPFYKQTAMQAGVGGSGVALLDPYKLNLLNPAVSAFSLDPVFQVSGLGSFSTFKTSTDEFDNKRFIINNIGLSLPIKRNEWGLTLGLVPLTSVGYDVVTEGDGGEDVGHYRAEYQGEGGINQFYVGTGYKVFSHIDSAANVTALALGANFNYNFGTIQNRRRINFTDDISTLGFEAKENFLVRDISFDFGLHFQTNLISRTLSNPRFLKLLIGGTYSLGGDLNTDRDAYGYNFNYLSNDLINPGDTLYAFENADGYIRYPSKYTVGFVLDYFSAQRRRIRFSADYSTQNWSEYEISYDDDALSFDFENSHRFSAGVEYTPETGSTDFFEAIQYRAGFKYEMSNLSLENQDIKDVGMSFGLTLPINLRRSLTNSTFHISGQYGTYGTTDNGLIQEDYVHVFVGFSFTPHFRNRWFVQPKYD